MSLNLKSPSLKLKQPERNNWLRTNKEPEWQKWRRVIVSVLSLMMLGLLVLNSTGCAPLSKSTQVHVSPRAELPKPPTPSTPIPSQSYSSSAQTDISKWRERLTDTPTTSRP